MVRFLADENFNHQIVRGVLRQKPDINIVRVQDVDLSGADDPAVLAWAAQEVRIVLTDDVATMITFAYQRIQAGLSMPGLFEVSRRVPVGLVIEEIILIDWILTDTVLNPLLLRYELPRLGKLFTKEGRDLFVSSTPCSVSFK